MVYDIYYKVTFLLLTTSRRKKSTFQTKVAHLKLQTLLRFSTIFHQYNTLSRSSNAFIAHLKLQTLLRFSTIFHQYNTLSRSSNAFLLNKPYKKTKTKTKTKKILFTFFQQTLFCTCRSQMHFSSSYSCHY